MTNWLTRFAQIVAGRTPGPWEVYFETGIAPFVATYGIKPNGFHELWECIIASGGKKKNSFQDLEFVALSGTVADEVLELASATDAYLTSRRVVGKELDWDMYERLEKALAKLAAKVSAQ